MLGQSGAIAKRPPHVGGPFNVYKTPITAAAGTAWTLFDGSSIPFGGCWVTFTASVDCYIHFYNADDTSVTTPSAAVSWPMMAGVEYDWWCNDKQDNAFRVIRAGTEDGVLSRYRSNL